MEKKIRFTFTVKGTMLEQIYIFEKVIPENMKYSVARMYERNFLEVLGLEILSVEIEVL